MEWKELEHFNGCYSVNYQTCISEPVGEAIFNLWNGNLFQLIIAWLRGHIWKYLYYVWDRETNTHILNLFTFHFQFVFAFFFFFSKQSISIDSSSWNYLMYI